MSDIIASDWSAIRLSFTLSFPYTHLCPPTPSFLRYMKHESLCDLLVIAVAQRYQAYPISDKQALNLRTCHSELRYAPKRSVSLLLCVSLLLGLVWVFPSLVACGSVPVTLPCLRPVTQIFNLYRECFLPYCHHDNKQAYDEYVKRLRPVLALDTQWHKTDEDLEAAVRKDSGIVVRRSTIAFRNNALGSKELDKSDVYHDHYQSGRLRCTRECARRGVSMAIDLTPLLR